MALPPSKIDETRGTEALIHDISKSGVRRSGASRPEQHLMLLAGDPLLMREYLRRQNTPAPKVLNAVPVSGETTIAIARSILAHGTLEYQIAGRPKRFLQREAMLEPSLIPSLFEPSGEDRDAALDHEQTPKDQGSGAAGHLSSAMVPGSVLLLLGLLLIWALATD